MTMHKDPNAPTSGQLARPGQAGVRIGDVVARALASRAGSTATELAAVTGLGRSTISKALAALEAAGGACRERGGWDAGRRVPDRWTSTVTSAAQTTATREASTARAGGSVTGRLGKGELAAMVLDYLAKHPDVEVGPTIVARALERSQGAVANALTRLVILGQAELTSEIPRRYRRAATP